MRTVRAKLLAIVVACLAPSIAAAVLRARESEADLFDQVKSRLRHADRAFAAELREDQSCEQLAARLSTRDPRLTQALASGDPAGARAVVAELGGIYTDTVILAANAKGEVLASSDPARTPASLAQITSARLGPLWQGKEVTGLLPLTLGKTAGYSLVVAEPVRVEGKQVGALALVTPIDPDYLAHIEEKLRSDLALKVNDQLVAASPGHPDPTLEVHKGGVVTREAGASLFALNTFKPKLLQAPDQEVEITISRDVTRLRNEARGDLHQSLAALGGVLLIVLVLALWMARRMAEALRKIGDAAASVRGGTYVDVEGVHTGDELERLAGDFNQMVAGLRERDHLKETFGKYVTRQVADRILLGNPVLGGELVPVTVLFSDIRSFTTISERMEPRALLDFLNVYFSGMVESVMQHHGVVDKFIGDAIMAVFGAPVPSPDDPLHAVQAALEMRARLITLNEGFKARGLPELRAGIGVHSGQVVAGNMGHVDRMEYTVIGDTVNLASRLESMTKELKVDVLLSEDTYLAVKDHVVAEALQKIHVKGREQEIMVYRLIGLKGEATRVA